MNEAMKSELEHIIRTTEQYFGRPLFQNEIKILAYIKCTLDFPNDLIDFLVVYCVETDHRSFHYIEKVAEFWHKKGIRTPKEASRLLSNKNIDEPKIMITAEMIQTLDDRALKWYRKHIAQFHQECLQFDKCYKGDPKNIFHEHFKQIEKLLSEEIERREQYYKDHGVL